MTGYLLRRAGTSIVVLIGVSIFVFFLLHTIYPSPAIDVLGQKADPRPSHGGTRTTASTTRSWCSTCTT